VPSTVSRDAIASARAFSIRLTRSGLKSPKGRPSHVHRVNLTVSKSAKVESLSVGPSTITSAHDGGAFRAACVVENDAPVVSSMSVRSKR